MLSKSEGAFYGAAVACGHLSAADRLDRIDLVALSLRSCKRLYSPSALRGIDSLLYTTAPMTITPSSPAPFGRWLKQLRSRHDLTQEALAELVACSVQTIRFFETGKRRPGLAMAERLADILQVPVEERDTFIRQARTALVNEPVADHPPAPAAVSLPHRHLPLPPAALIGREAEINVLHQLFLHERHRLVTVLGVGGMGKTRLALATAAALGRHFPDGAAFVALAPLQAAHQLPGAVADALGIVLQGARDTQEQVLQHLATRQLLLVLDNFEHLLNDELGRATQWLLELLRRAPALSLLVTSRERLRLSGERIFELGGLALPQSTTAPEQADAVQLFVERAQSVDSTFALTAQNADAISRICRLMDGMPLALELAAAWVRLLSCAEIADEIQRSLDFLVLADRDMTPRHRSMRAVFDHSWSLLTAEEQRTLAALSVFRGGCSREAAQAVTGTTLPVLAALIDKSLLRRSGETPGQARYELHELTRQYAAQRLAADTATEQSILARHCAFYAQFVKTQELALGGPQQMAAIVQIEEEIDNIRSAWQLAVEQHWFAPLQQMINGLGEAFYWRSRYHEGVMLCRTLVEQLQRQSELTAEAALLFCLARTWLGCFLTQIGEVATVEVLFQEVFAHLAELAAAGQDIRSCQALAQHELAYFYIGTVGHYEQALTLQSASVALYRQLGNDHALGRALARESRILHFLGRYHEAITVIKEAIALGQRNGDQLVTVSAVEGLALSLTYLGEFAAAEPHFRTALAAAEATHQPGRTAGVLTNLGVVLTFAGRFTEGQEVWQRALAIGQAISDRSYIVHSTVLLGFSSLHVGDYVAACAQAEEGMAQSSRFVYVRDGALARILLGSAQLGLGHLAAARSTLDEAIALYRPLAHPDELGWAMAVQVYVLRAQGAGAATQRMAVTAIETVLTAQGFNAVASLLPIVALLLLDQAQSELARIIAVALQSNGFVQQSVWFAQVAMGELTHRLAMQPGGNQPATALPSAIPDPNNSAALLRQAVLLLSTPHA